MEALTHKKHSFQTVQDVIDWVKSYAGVKVTGLNKWSGMEGTFVKMVWTDGRDAQPGEEPTKELRCRIRLKHGHEIDLKSQNCQFIDKII